MSAAIDIKNLNSKLKSWKVGDFIIITSETLICRIVHSGTVYSLIDMSTGFVVEDIRLGLIKYTSLPELQKKVTESYSNIRHYSGNSIRISLSEL